MHQQTLFRLNLQEPDICENRHGGSVTSILSDKRVAKERDRATVYGYIKAAGLYGHTLDEISILLDRHPNRISGRFSELRKRGQIVATEVTRLTRTGSPARVYVVAS